MEKTLTVEDLVAVDDTHTIVVFCAECGGIVKDCTHIEAEYLACEW